MRSYHVIFHFPVSKWFTAVALIGRPEALLRILMRPGPPLYLKFSNGVFLKEFFSNKDLLFEAAAVVTVLLARTASLAGFRLSGRPTAQKQNNRINKFKCILSRSFGHKSR